MARRLTPEQEERVLDLLTELAREGDTPTAADVHEERILDRLNKTTDPYEDGKQEVREKVADRCASLLREIRGYI